MSSHLLRDLRMHLRRAVAGIVLIAALVALSAPALAGGYAVVRLDEPPGDVLVATPWRFGFMVLQHDVTPNSDVTPVVRALHKETGEEVTATGRQEGAVGHFVAEVTFPRAGEWKWSIEPLPYAETSFETLTVLESPGALSFTAQIVTGSCAAPGDVAFSLGDVAPQVITEKSAALPDRDRRLDHRHPAVEAARHRARDRHRHGSNPTPSWSPAATSRAPQARPATSCWVCKTATNAENIGLAVLREEGERTAVTLYLLNPDRVGDASETAPGGA